MDEGAPGTIPPPPPPPPLFILPSAASLPSSRAGLSKGYKDPSQIGPFCVYVYQYQTISGPKYHKMPPQKPDAAHFIVDSVQIFEKKIFSLLR
jgi:hypothetical protein